MTVSSPQPVLSVQGLSKTYMGRAGLTGRRIAKAAIRDVSFEIGEREILGLVGESGSGKTTVGRTAMRLIDPSEGTIRLGDTDITTLGHKAMHPFRSRMQMVFQDPSASLNPRQTIRQILRTPLRLRGVTTDDEIVEILGLVGMGSEVLDRSPAMFSGGQRQRLSIARALLMHPDLIVADEAVSSLDVCVQAQVVNLFLDLRDRLGLSILFIGHDLPVVGVISDRIGVMYRGMLVEIARTQDLFSRPRHPYTASLLAAAPRYTGPSAPVSGAPETPPDVVTERSVRSVSASSCVFSSLCAHAVTECFSAQPALREVSPGHRSACLRTDLILDGVHGDPANSKE